MTRTNRRQIRALWPAIIAWGCWIILPASPAHAISGKEGSKSDFDLTLTVDCRWAGTAYGGYYPLRMRIVNRGETRELKFRFSSAEDGPQAMPVVERLMKVDQNATVQFSLSVPMVSSGSSGRVQVFHAGRELEGLTTSVALAESGAGDGGRTSLLVISNDNVDCSRFEQAVTALSGNPSAPGGGIVMHGAHRGGRAWAGARSTRAEDNAFIPPVLLPETWIDYSGLDIIAVSQKTLERMAGPAREALLKWTDCGGNLLVYGVGQPADQSQDLARLLEFERFASGGTGWTAADLNLRRPIPAANLEVAAQAVPGAAAKPPDSNHDDSDLVASATEFTWADAPETFMRRERLLGQVFAFPGDPFPGTPNDWNWWLNSIGAQRALWSSRIGIASARQPSPEFIKFLIPGVGDVPIYAFLGLISLFTVVIGPLNYFVLWRRRQLYLLVLTIPAIALATTCSLFGYATMAEGFGVKSRVLSFTLCDQTAKTAVSTSRISLYAGMAPSTGLTFSRDTAVFPVWPIHEAFESGRLDWTNNYQQLTSGWIRSRTRTQFLTLAHRVERGRIEVQPVSKNAESLQIANGFPWKLRTLLVIEPSGGLYLGRNIAAGAVQDLAKTTTAEAQTSFNELLTEHPLKAPDGFEDSSPFFGGFRYNALRRIVPDDSPAALTGQGLLQGGLEALRSIDKRDGLLRPRTYVAVFAENPGTEIGISGASELVSFHVLVGRY